MTLNPFSGNVRGEIPQTSQVASFFENSDAPVTEPCQKGSAGYGSRTTAYESYFLSEIIFPGLRGQHLTKAHFLEHLEKYGCDRDLSESPSASADGRYLRRKLLKSSNVDGSFLRRLKVASAHAQVAGRANHSAGQSQGIVGEYRFGRPVVVLKRTI